MRLARRETRTKLYYQYTKASDAPLMILALLMIPVLLLPEVWRLPGDINNLLDTIDWLIYACFATDYLLKLYLAPSAIRHIKANWLDLLVLALPLLRPLRIVQSARLLRLLRAARIIVFLAEGLRKLRGILAGRGLNIVLLVTLGVVVSTAGLVAVFENQGEGNIKGFGDALWWAVATVTTVGYGDATPVTPEGRGLAVFLMLTGIVFYSILTANIAAYFVESKENKTDQQLSDKLDLILQRLAVLETSISNGEFTQEQVEGKHDPPFHTPGEHIK